MARLMAERGIRLAAATCVMVAGGVALFAHEAGAQQTKATPQPSAPKAAPAPAQPGPAGPQRVETIQYDNWTVSCRDVVGGTAKKTCSAQLSLRFVQDNQQQALGAWVIGRNETGALVSLLQLAHAAPAVQIQKGVTLKLGNAPARKLDYLACSPKLCEATIVMDNAMLKDAAAAENATITMHLTNGKDVNINVQSIRGFDKAIAAIGR
jgi:invasion protein IalB